MEFEEAVKKLYLYFLEYRKRGDLIKTFTNKLIT